MKNWKTTAAGILTALIALSTAVKAMIDGDPATNPEWTIVVAAFVTAIGLIMAKDSTTK